MPRRPRSDYPGAWHHVWNRGISKRTLFETRKDVRSFLACLARQARSGDLEIHAYSILTTHYHLLVRSPHGRLSAAMQRAQDAYARSFNRTRRRDGPLFRGRFGNRVIDSDAYWWSVLRYIDRNPVEALLCARPRDYPHGSAGHYCRARGPAWLRRDAVEEAFGRRADGPWNPSAYVVFDDEPLSAGQRWLAERRREQVPSREGRDPLDELLGAAPERVRRWMEGKARLADGTLPGNVLVAPGTVLALLRARRGREPGRVVATRGRARPLWDTLEVGLLRDSCGLRFREMAREIGASVGTVQDRLRIHAEGLVGDPVYAAEAASLLAEAIAQDHGEGPRRMENSADGRPRTVHEQDRAGPATSEEAAVDPGGGPAP